MVYPAEIDLMNHLGAGCMQGGHGFQVSGQYQAPFSVGLPVGHLSGGLGNGDKSDLDPWSDGHPIELLLPFAGRHLIIHQNNEIDAQGTAPPDHHLSVDKPVIDPAQHDGHQGSLIEAWPVAAARVAASWGESVRWKTKSTSMARLTPVTTLTDCSDRKRLRTAKRQEPLAISTNTTAGGLYTAANTRCSSVSRSQPVFDTGVRAASTPLICSAAFTSASAIAPWQTTTPRNSSLILFLEILLDSALLLHPLDETRVECSGHVYS